jgi:hypothetical protein
MTSIRKLWALLSVIGVVFVAHALEHPAAVEQWEFTQIEKLASSVERPMTGDQPGQCPGRRVQYGLRQENVGTGNAASRRRGFQTG